MELNGNSSQLVFECFGSSRLKKSISIMDNFFIVTMFCFLFAEKDKGKNIKFRGV